ncbi:MAG: hypothetical protein WBV82_31760 [Myxococcaceae bacterium]
MTLVRVSACAALVLASGANAGEADASPICSAEVTRKAGWYMYRPAALEACLSGGPLRFGHWQVKTAEDALRLLWGESAEGVRHRLARSLLVARCNQACSTPPRIQPTCSWTPSGRWMGPRAHPWPC